MSYSRTLQPVSPCVFFRAPARLDRAKRCCSFIRSLGLERLTRSCAGAEAHIRRGATRSSCSSTSLCFWAEFSLKTCITAWTTASQWKSSPTLPHYNSSYQITRPWASRCKLFRKQDTGACISPPCQHLRKEKGHQESLNHNLGTKGLVPAGCGWSIMPGALRFAGFVQIPIIQTHE